MPYVLHFAPACKPSLSLSDLLSSPNKSSKKRKRCLEPSDDDSNKEGGECTETDSLTNEISRYSNAFVTTSIGAPGEVASGMVKERIRGELATLRPPVYIANAKLPTIPTENNLGDMGLRHHHLNAITAVLHKCLSEYDYIRAGRAWATLLRAEQHGQSIDFKLHDRWGIGAEILMQRQSQMAQETLDHKSVEISSSMSHLGVTLESIEKAKEYYERLVLQYPYRKAFPNATGALKFSIAIFSLWVYAIQKRSQRALAAAGSSDEDGDMTDAQANDNIQKTSVAEVELNRYRKREKIKISTLTSAHEIAARLNGLLESPPYSDDAKLRNLCREVSSWISDLSNTTVISKSGTSLSGDDKGLTSRDSSPLKHVSRSASLSEEI